MIGAILAVARSLTTRDIRSIRAAFSMTPKSAGGTGPGGGIIANSPGGGIISYSPGATGTACAYADGLYRRGGNLLLRPIQPLSKSSDGLFHLGYGIVLPQLLGLQSRFSLAHSTRHLQQSVLVAQFG